MVTVTVANDAAVGERQHAISHVPMTALCVMTAVVVCTSRLTRAMALSTTAPVVASSAPVGSSHSSTSRSCGNRACNGNPLLLTAGKLRGEMIQSVTEPNEIQRFLGREHRARQCR